MLDWTQKLHILTLVVSGSKPTHICDPAHLSCTSGCVTLPWQMQEEIYLGVIFLIFHKEIELFQKWIVTWKQSPSETDVFWGQQQARKLFPSPVSTGCRWFDSERRKRYLLFWKVLLVLPCFMSLTSQLHSGYLSWFWTGRQSILCLGQLGIPQQK